MKIYSRRYIGPRYPSEYNRFIHRLYLELIFQHEITGCAFLRLSDDALRRMGIKSDQDREAILREILKQRLKADIMEFRDIDFMNIYYN